MPLVLASFARHPYQMRSPHDLSVFFEQLGLHPSDIKKAFTSVIDLINKNKLKKSDEWIREGVMKV